MEKQPELFKEFAVEKDRKKPFYKNLITDRNFVITLTYDRIIVIGLGIMFICGLFYVAGIEGGRRRGQREMHAAMARQKKPLALPSKAETIIPDEIVKAANNSLRRYAIQIATFKSEQLAKKEIQNVSNVGLPIQISEKDGYFRIFVGDFSEKNEADPYVQKLRKRYSDCFVRPL